MRTVLLAALVTAIAACATTAEVASGLRPSDLNGAPDRYDSTEVVAYGYLQVEPEARGLWQDKSALDAGHIDRCVSVLVPKSFDLSGYDRSYVVIKGRFVKTLGPSTIHLGACNFTHLILSERPKLAPAPKAASWPNNSFKPNPLRGSA
jgi:hypothetical protein